MKKYVLEIIVFVCGAAVMILELVGSRVLAPYVGTSIVVWASLIGVVLGSLSLGYWWGGKMADLVPTYRRLSLIILSSAAYIILVGVLKDAILSGIQANIKEIRLSSLLATLILFAPPGILLGMVSPYAVKLRMDNLKTSGQTIGNLYAISTIGSIVGTFTAGFVLIVYLGNTNILFFISGMLIVASLIGHTGGRDQKIVTAVMFFLAITCTMATVIYSHSMKKEGYLDVDTLYNRIMVYSSTDKETGRPIRLMRTDYHSVQSVMFADKDNDLAVAYTKYYRMAAHFMPVLKQVLMIGGGAYSYPKDFIQKFPSSAMDVVEIDPGVTKLAREYFNLKDNARLPTFNEDGRVFINSSPQKYDAILVDAFKSFYSIPYQLSTREAIQQEYRILNNGGVVLVNIASAFEGDKGVFLRAEYATYKSVFPQVYLFQVGKNESGTSLQNIMLVALKTNQVPTFSDPNPEISDYLSRLWTRPIAADYPILTDEHSPVDYYLMKTL